MKIWQLWVLLIILGGVTMASGNEPISCRDHAWRLRGEGKKDFANLLYHLEQPKPHQERYNPDQEFDQLVQLLEDKQMLLAYLDLDQEYLSWIWQLRRRMYAQALFELLQSTDSANLEAFLTNPRSGVTNERELHQLLLRVIYGERDLQPDSNWPGKGAALKRYPNLYPGPVNPYDFGKTYEEIGAPRIDLRRYERHQTASSPGRGQNIQWLWIPGTIRK